MKCFVRLSRRPRPCFSCSLCTPAAAASGTRFPYLGHFQPTSSRWTSQVAGGREAAKSSTKGKSLPAPISRWPNSLVTLAVETSCDDTCVAILEKEREPAASQNGGRRRARLLFEERVTADNRAFGGIHPLTASESHMAALARLVQRAVPYLPTAASTAAEGAATSTRPDFVAATRGPGMPASLASGLAVAQGLAVAWDVPLVGVHHMQAHALTPRLVEAMEAAKKEVSTQKQSSAVCFPYLSFLVSGGHTLLVHSRSLVDHRVLAAAANIAVGDMLDKCARAILPPAYIADAEAQASGSLPYGALLERFAFGPDDQKDGSYSSNNSHRYQSQYQYPAARRDEMATFESGRGWSLPAPLGTGALRRALRFDFSGLNGAVIKLLEAGAMSSSAKTDSSMSDDDRRLLARATMQQAFEHLASRLLLALDGGAGGQSAETPPPTCLVVAGGVASNRFLRHVLRSALDVRGYGNLPVVAPPPSLCTDNAAMIAWAGMEMFEAGWQTELGVLPIRKWPMDADAPGGGILGPGGWTQRS